MDRVESLLAEAVNKKANGGIPGAVLAVVDKDGNYLYKNSFGSSGVAEDAAPLAFDSTYAIASCTKLIVSIAALQCVDKGLIGLDDSLDKLIPELFQQPIIEPAPENTEGLSFRLKNGKNPITVRQLLTHSSGTVYEFGEPLIAAWRTSIGRTTETRRGQVVTDFAYPRSFEAGEDWNYGSGLDWAGLAVGRLNNSTLGAFAEEHIFKPLGMSSTTWHLEQKPTVAQKLMAMSSRQQDETLVPGPERILADPSIDETGGAGLYSSVPDYTRVLADLLKESPVLLKKETVDLLCTPQFAEGTGAYNGLHAKSEGYYRLFVGGSVEGCKFNHGLGGLLVMDDIDKPNYFKPRGTLTWAGLPNVVWSMNREKGKAILFATQVHPWGDEIVQKLVQEFETAVWRATD